MSNEVSNKVLASLLVVAIVVSVAGTMFSLGKLGGLSSITGRQATEDNETGQANITITGVVGISVAGVIDFGEGYTNDNGTTLRISTDSQNSNGFNDCTAGTFPSSFGVCKGLEVENTGNVNVTVDVATSTTPNQFIGGSSPTMNFSGVDGFLTSGAAAGCSGTVASAHTPLNATYQSLCSDLDFANSGDRVVLEMEIGIPADAPVDATNSQMVINFTASQV